MRYLVDFFLKIGPLFFRRHLSQKVDNLANQVVDDVRTYMGEKVYETIIPRNVRISEAPSYGKPAILYDLKCAGSQAYLKLAFEVIRREGSVSKQRLLETLGGSLSGAALDRALEQVRRRDAVGAIEAINVRQAEVVRRPGV